MLEFEGEFWRLPFNPKGRVIHMGRKYVGFDIETEAIIPEGENLRDHRPLGITCVGFDTAEDGTTTIGAVGEHMMLEEIKSVVAALERYVEEGYTIATWNGLAFDFDILAEEAADPELGARIAKLATGEHHVDLMFHFLCVKGFRCGLAKACEGMEIEGKVEGMSGASAPELWATGEREKVLEYVGQDACIQRRLVEKVEADRRLYWVTAKGTLSHAVMGKPRTPREALRIPEPDVTWMDNPPARKWSYWWTKQYGVRMEPEEPKVF